MHATLSRRGAESRLPRVDGKKAGTSAPFKEGGDRYLKARQSPPRSCRSGKHILSCFALSYTSTFFLLRHRQVLLVTPHPLPTTTSPDTSIDHLPVSIPIQIGWTILLAISHRSVASATYLSQNRSSPVSTTLCHGGDTRPVPACFDHARGLEPRTEPEECQHWHPFRRRES